MTVAGRVLRLGRLGFNRADLASGWVAAVIAGIALCSAPATAQSCRGDCDGDGLVTVNELVTGVNIALEQLEFSTCPSFDSNADGEVTVDEIITALGYAVNGCPIPVCTPPLCHNDEVFHCPDSCPGGCGTICVTPTPTQSATATTTATLVPSPTPSSVSTAPSPTWTETPLPTCAPTGTPYCSDECIPCPTIRANCPRYHCGTCIQNPTCTDGEVQQCPGGTGSQSFRCCGCATPTPTPSAPTPTTTPTPDCTNGPCPDLVPGAINAFFPTPVGGCRMSVLEMPQYFMDVCVGNAGTAASGPFDISVDHFDFFRVPGLQPTEYRCQRRSFRQNGQLLIDYAGEVRESNEANNTTTFSLAIPSYAPTCTAGVETTPTPTVTMPGPSPTSCAGGTPIVDPVTSPTDELQATIRACGRNAGASSVVVYGQTGAVATCVGNCGSSCQDYHVSLLANQTNHILVCQTNGSCPLNPCTNLDRNGGALEIVQQSPPPSPTPLP